MLEGGKLPSGVWALSLQLPSSKGVTGRDTYFRKITLDAAELSRQEAAGAWTRLVAAGMHPGTLCRTWWWMKHEE